MRSLLISFILAASLVGANFAQNQPLIIGGQDVAPGEFPSLVSIKGGVNEGFLCGGTLIQRKVVATLASCLYNSPDDLRFPMNTIRVTAGDYLLDKKDFGEQIQELKEIIVHPEFSLSNRDDAANMIASNDIALLVTTYSFNLTANISLATLPSAYTLNTATVGTVVGWGFRNDGDFKDYLPAQKVQLKVVDNATCSGKYQSNGFDPNSQFCAGAPTANSQGVCENDYGGPFVVGPNKDFMGVISFIRPGGGVDCAKDSTGTPITRVDPYATWIQDTLGMVPPPTTPPTTTTTTTTTSTTTPTTTSESTPTTPATTGKTPDDDGDNSGMSLKIQFIVPLALLGVLFFTSS